jgi:uncharacterized protein (DUF983 family)
MADQERAPAGRCPQCGEERELTEPVTHCEWCGAEYPVPDEKPGPATSVSDPGSRRHDGS